jgi:hypothetical protein
LEPGKNIQKRGADTQAGNHRTKNKKESLPDGSSSMNNQPISTVDEATLSGTSTLDKTEAQGTKGARVSG